MGIEQIISEPLIVIPAVGFVFGCIVGGLEVVQLRHRIKHDLDDHGQALIERGRKQS